jgi:hypothetical protein
MSASAAGNILGDIGKFADILIGEVCIHFWKIQDKFAWGNSQYSALNCSKNITEV